MTAHLSDRDLARMSRIGLAPLPTEQALELFDTAMVVDHPGWWPPAWTGPHCPTTPPRCRRCFEQLVSRPTRRVIADTDDTASISGLAARLHGLAPKRNSASWWTWCVAAPPPVLGRARTLQTSTPGALSRPRL